MKWLLILTAVQLFQNNAQAFNPVAFVAGVRAVSGIMGGVDGVDEVAGVGLELVGLLEDLDVDKSSEREVDEATVKLQELDQRLRKTRSIHSEMTALMRSDLERANTLKEQIRTLKAMIGKTKRIADLMRGSPKAGTAAADVQGLRVNTMILEELQMNRRRQDLVQLNQTNAKAERLLLMDELRSEYEAKAR